MNLGVSHFVLSKSELVQLQIQELEEKLLRDSELHEQKIRINEELHKQNIKALEMDQQLKAVKLEIKEETFKKMKGGTLKTNLVLLHHGASFK